MQSVSQSVCVCVCVRCASFCFEWFCKRKHMATVLDSLLLASVTFDPEAYEGQSLPYQCFNLDFFLCIIENVIISPIRAIGHSAGLWQWTSIVLKGTVCQNLHISVLDRRMDLSSKIFQNLMDVIITIVMVLFWSNNFWASFGHLSRPFSSIDNIFCHRGTLNFR